MKKLFVASMLILFSIPSFSQVYLSGKLVGAKQAINVASDWADYTPPYHESHESFEASDMNFGAKIAIGTMVVKNVRAEIEYGYYSKFASSDTHWGSETTWWTGDTQINTFMVNAYYDFNNSSKFTPYVVAGIGMAKVKISGKVPGVQDEAIPNGTTNNVAFNFGGGVGYSLTENITLDLGIKYNNFGEIKGTIDDGIGIGTGKHKYSNIEGSLGVRYTF